MSEVGPVQLLAIGFGREAQHEGPVRDELERLARLGLVRVVDLLFVGIDADTEEIVALSYQGDDLGALVGALDLAARGLERAMRETTVGVPGALERGPAPPRYLAELEQLAALKANGVLTDDEYEQKKRQILGI